MFWRPWFFWKFLLRRMAKAQGFLDPVAVFSDLRRFARPAEVWVPTELLRSGALMQVRGLLNTQVIQNNADWIWPYWAEEQFNPASPSFIPHALSPTHINLTHRNWTALGLPGMSEYPIVDPRGLMTPFYDGWSVDVWLWKNASQLLVPSRCRDVRQALVLGEDRLEVDTRMKEGEFSLELRSLVTIEDSRLHCRMSVRAQAPAESWLAVVLRPYNPEGVSFINRIALKDAGPGWVVDDKRLVHFDKTPAAYFFSDYERGDVFSRFLEIPTAGDGAGVRCKAGMASSAALFPVRPGAAAEMQIDVPLNESRTAVSGWREALSGVCRLEIPDTHYKALFDKAVYSLILHSPEDVYPGPYMYRRFWFRDAAFILNAMLSVNLEARVEKVLDRFQGRQTAAGYFLSQNGEWDSNGQALWILERFAAMTGRPPKKQWRQPVLSAAAWIMRKRTKKDGSPHAGLLPAGFSAEHFGPSDHYFWDDFWAAAGLRSAAAMARGWNEAGRAREFEEQASDLLECVDRTLQAVRRETHMGAVPPTPYRRLDGGSIGALVATYPLQLWEAGDPRVRDTIEFLIRNFMIRNGFYQKIGHAGINAYLSLHIAQALMRAGDRRFEPIVRAVADLASPTGQWPEAVHPRTGGGCMGDGQHIWASAEWVLMIRNFFVCEEEKTGTLVIGSGIPRAWLDSAGPLFMGPVRTLFGKISLSIRGGAVCRVSWDSVWHTPPKRIVVRLAGCPETLVSAGRTSVEIPGGAA